MKKHQQTAEKSIVQDGVPLVTPTSELRS